MPKTEEQHRAAIANIEKIIWNDQKTIDALKKEREGILEKFSNAETNKHNSDLALHRNKINKTWIFFSVGAGICFLLSFLYAAYWMKDPNVENLLDGFRYNGVPLIMVILAFVFAAFAVWFFIAKRRNAASFFTESVTANKEYERILAVLKCQDEAIEDAQNLLKTHEQEHHSALDAFYADFPEELQKIKDEADAKKKEALAQLAWEEQINMKAAMDARKKQEDMVEGQKMFDHPQAYILDGLFENEYDVFCRSADLGCQDAQLRVVEILLGITYKNGVKPDVSKGEELALRYGANGNNAMYEVLGKGYLYGEGNIPKNEEKGLKYLEKASAKGRQKAMIMAAVCHYNGVGTEKDEKRARVFFEKAARQGNAQAIQVLTAMDNGEKLRF